MTIVPMRESKGTVRIEQYCKEADGPVFVTKNGYGRLVVMDIEYYEKIMRKVYEAKLIAEGMADVEAGRVSELDEVRSRMLKKWDC